MSGSRPSRAARVVYREVDSDDSSTEDEVREVEKGGSEETSDDDYSPGDTVADCLEKLTKPRVFPPLSPLQREFRVVCRLGDKVRLKQFITNHPGLEMDIPDHDGGTALNEAVTKTAQFSGIVEVLLDSGARLDVTDALGNTPLHNAVLYHPSTQDTVDILLTRGADPRAKNYDGSTPVTMADDKDLKEVLKEVNKGKKGSKKGVCDNSKIYSSLLRKRVFDQSPFTSWKPENITVKFNGASPVPASPGLLKKRKREDDNLDSSYIKPEKRIRWNEQDSTGAFIEPKFSDSEDSDTANNSDDSSIIIEDECEASPSAVQQLDSPVSEGNSVEEEDSPVSEVDYVEEETVDDLPSDNDSVENSEHDNVEVIDDDHDSDPVEVNEQISNVTLTHAESVPDMGVSINKNVLVAEVNCVKDDNTEISEPSIDATSQNNIVEEHVKNPFTGKSFIKLVKKQILHVDKTKSPEAPIDDRGHESKNKSSPVINCIVESTKDDESEIKQPEETPPTPINKSEEVVPEKKIRIIKFSRGFGFFVS